MSDPALPRLWCSMKLSPPFQRKEMRRTMLQGADASGAWVPSCWRTRRLCSEQQGVKKRPRDRSCTDFIPLCSSHLRPAVPHTLGRRAPTHDQTPRVYTPGHGLSATTKPSVKGTVDFVAAQARVRGSGSDPSPGSWNCGQGARGPPHTFAIPHCWPKTTVARGAGAGGQAKALDLRSGPAD